MVSYDGLVDDLVTSRHPSRSLRAVSLAQLGWVSIGRIADHQGKVWCEPYLADRELSA